MAYLHGNGVYIVMGEISTVMTSMKKVHWSAKSYQEEDKNPLIKNLAELEKKLLQVSDLGEVKLLTILSPFLDIIRSRETSIPVTVYALASIKKFISYGLLGGYMDSVLLSIINNIADAVAHANFISSDNPSDNVILMEIIDVLRTLVLSPLGYLLSNESMCDIMLSCFKMCFETRLDELLRRSAEHCLKDIVQLLFVRLPHFHQGSSDPIHMKKMRISSKLDKNADDKKRRSQILEDAKMEETTPPSKSEEKSQRNEQNSPPAVTTAAGKSEENFREKSEGEKEEIKRVEITTSEDDENEGKTAYVNSQGVRFMSEDPNLEDWAIAEHVPLSPHDGNCVQELLRFLSWLCDPYDKQNTEAMIRISLNLLTVALEVGAESASKHPALLAIVKDILCRNLLALLLNTERLPIFNATLHAMLLLFATMRSHLKFQMEYYLSRLTADVISSSDQSKVSQDKKEFALKSLMKLWKISNFPAELFINYDCDLYCANLYEEITRLLSKNVYPTSGFQNIHLLCLDGLLTVVEDIAGRCKGKMVNGGECLESTRDKKVKTFVVPNAERIKEIKREKAALTSGTEHFNCNPKKGIQFLQEQGVLSDPLQPSEVAAFLRENPYLDKKMIGEFISHRGNLNVLEHFVKLFDFKGLRLDMALRMFLEAFRLPGEAPLVSLVMQHFADTWHAANDEPFAKSDAAFVLSYAIIMLNVDQHNQTAKRQMIPMTVEDFKKNLKGENGGADFPPELLEEIYKSIKNEEIVMPAEHVGPVRERYLWKLLLRRSCGKDGAYTRPPEGNYDKELFQVCWVPVVTALSYVFDKANDADLYYKAIRGFGKCATIAAYYSMSYEFDNLTLTLCKFTTLNSAANEWSEPCNAAAIFGANAKALLATETAFHLVHQHGDMLREGWKPVFDCIYQLFRRKLLPKILAEADDFLELSGKISLVRERDEAGQKATESGLLSSLYSYITAATEMNQKVLSEDEENAVQMAKTCVEECHVENLILVESKFLRLEALNELLEVLIKACYSEDGFVTLGSTQGEDKVVFFLEMLLKVVIQNRDRATALWQTVCDHLYALVTAASKCGSQFVLERCVIGLLRLAIRLVSREDITSSVLQSLQMLLSLRRSALRGVRRQIAYGLFELLKTGAVYVKCEADWSVVFTLLEVVGAGAPLPKVLTNEGKSDVESQEETIQNCLSGSDSSLSKAGSNLSSPKDSYLFLDVCEMESKPFYHSGDLISHDAFALVKCCESLTFLARSYVTPANYENCVHCVRTFVEAALLKEKRRKADHTINSQPQSNQINNKKKKKSRNPEVETDEWKLEEYPNAYHEIPFQLLDLMHTLHTNTAAILKDYSETFAGSLWPLGWCPLLQGIARLCCDSSKTVRMSAVTNLQRALLMHDLQTLTALEWESCFNHVMFPLLEILSDPERGLSCDSSDGVEETRMRAATLLSKVFLHHLTPLQSLPTFTTLWLKILDFMDRYTNIDKNGDLLNEAIRESVKNMILVMESGRLFTDDEDQNAFWTVTWDRVAQFLPNLKEELDRYYSTAAAVGSKANVPNSNYEEYKKEEEVEVEREKFAPNGLNNADLVKNSVTIFPHMGQLISTPIGPIGGREISNSDENDRDNDGEGAMMDDKNETTRVTSLIYPSQDFPLTQLPLIRSPSPSRRNDSTVDSESKCCADVEVGIPPEPEKNCATKETTFTSSLPVYSGFSKLNVDCSGYGNAASQFFYQDLNSLQSNQNQVSAGKLVKD